MNTYTDKKQNDKNQSVKNRKSQEYSAESTFQFVDNRPEAIAQRKLQDSINVNPETGQTTRLFAGVNNITSQAIQRKENAVVQRDEDDEEDSDEDRETWIEWSKAITYQPGYTSWPGWHINWTLGDGDQYHVTNEETKAHYFFKLEGGKPVASAVGSGKGKNAFTYDKLPKRVRKFIETSWKRMLR